MHTSSQTARTPNRNGERRDGKLEKGNIGNNGWRGRVNNKRVIGGGEERTSRLKETRFCKKGGIERSEVNPEDSERR